MSQYTDYISRKKEDILLTSEEANPVRLREIYKSLKDKSRILSIGGPSYQKIARELWNINVTRATVRKCFKDGLYSGFVAAMLWGGLGSDGRTVSHLEKAVAENKKADIEEKLKRVKDLLDAGEIDKAFKSMCPRGRNKIEGVDVSYFTKLLFFMGDASVHSTVVPLIYDKWGWHIHAAILLSQRQKEKVLDFFQVCAVLKKEKPSNKMGISVFLANSGNKRSQAYMSYIDLMQRQSHVLSEKLFPGNLEQFLFGKARRGRDARAEDNPRNVLVNYLNNELSKLYKEAEGEIITEDSDEKTHGDKSAPMKKARFVAAIPKPAQVELRVVRNTFGCKYPTDWPKPATIILETETENLLAAVPTFISTGTIRSREITRYIKEQGYSEAQIVRATMSVETGNILRIRVLK